MHPAGPAPPFTKPAFCLSLYELTASIFVVGMTYCIVLYCFQIMWCCVWFCHLLFPRNQHTWSTVLLCCWNSSQNNWVQSLEVCSVLPCVFFFCVYTCGCFCKLCDGWSLPSPRYFSRVAVSNIVWVCRVIAVGQAVDFSYLVLYIYW